MENNSDQDIEEKKQKAKEKFEANYNEFKKKKIKEIPCLRSTFLTCNFFNNKFINI